MQSAEGGFPAASSTDPAGGTLARPGSGDACRAWDASGPSRPRSGKRSLVTGPPLLPAMRRAGRETGGGWLALISSGPPAPSSVRVGKTRTPLSRYTLFATGTGRFANRNLILVLHAPGDDSHAR